MTRGAKRQDTTGVFDRKAEAFASCDELTARQWSRQGLRAPGGGGGANRISKSVGDGLKRCVGSLADSPASEGDEA